MGAELMRGMSVRQKVTNAYLVIFYALAIWKWSDGGWLFQYEPFVFQTRMDGTTWLFFIGWNDVKGCFIIQRPYILVVFASYV